MLIPFCGVSSLHLVSPSFRQRSASALTDPVTIGAVAILFLNDLVLKQIWPDSWLPGKLSDFAWLVFACPLLAFLMSLPMGRRATLDRPAFLAAYLGLPLLYLIFNSFAAVHDLVLSGLLPLTSITSGSPLDPSDSLMIPLSMAVALWIWYRSAGTALRCRLRPRFAFACAVVAMVASVATSPSDVSENRWHVALNSEGAVVMEMPDPDLFISDDGGQSWVHSDYRPHAIARWGGQEVEPPRGVYSVDEAGVWLRRPGADPELVLSAAFLSGGPARWAQLYSREGLNLSVNDPEGGRAVSRPVNLVYHEPSDNVVVSFAAEGVVVGHPGGSWTRTAVGQFQPTDFSYPALLVLLFAGTFWLGVFSFAALFAIAGVLFSERPVSSFSPLLNRILVALRWVTFLAVVLLVISAAFGLSAIGWAWAAALLFLFAFLTLRPGDVLTRAFIAVLAGLGASVSVYGFPAFSGAGGDLIAAAAQYARVTGMLLSLLALLLLMPNLRHRRAFTAALVSMAAVIVALSAIWLSGRLSGAMTVAAAVLLLFLIAVLLSEHLRRSGDDAGQSNV